MPEAEASAVNFAMPPLSVFTLKKTEESEFAGILKSFVSLIFIAPSLFKTTFAFFSEEVPLKTVTGTSIVSPMPMVRGRVGITIRSLFTFTVSSFIP